jgi:hypothetical protein
MSDQPIPQAWPPASNQPPKSLKGKRLALTALVLGIFGICLSLIPVLWITAFPPAVVGLVFGLIAITEANRVRAGKGLALVGTILCVLALVLAAFFATAVPL